MSSKHKNPTISFRVTDAERKQIEARILASGMMKKDYFIRSCIYNRICVVGKKETIYPLVQTVNALYLRLLEMQNAFTGTDADTVTTAIPDTLPSSDVITELKTEYINILTAIIDLLMVQNICGKEISMNNNLNFQFGMYDPATDSIIVNSGENSVLVIRCKECNSSVIFEEPNDIVYLCRLAEESPLTYAKLALKENGLQDYVDGMNELN